MVDASISSRCSLLRCSLAFATHSVKKGCLSVRFIGERTDVNCDEGAKLFNDMGGSAWADEPNVEHRHVLSSLSGKNVQQLRGGMTSGGNRTDRQATECDDHSRLARAIHRGRTKQRSCRAM